MLPAPPNFDMGFPISVELFLLHASEKDFIFQQAIPKIKLDRLPIGRGNSREVEGTNGAPGNEPAPELAVNAGLKKIFLMLHEKSVKGNMGSLIVPAIPGLIGKILA